MCISIVLIPVVILKTTPKIKVLREEIVQADTKADEGDLIFFENTYESHEPLTHVGIYAGDGKMLHCGAPIKYASTLTPYWKSHFYTYGRLEN